MQQVDHLVEEIATEANAGSKKPIDPVLVAYALRMELVENPERYPSAAELTEEMQDELKRSLVLRLRSPPEADPRMDTLRMQARFDGAFVRTTQRLQAAVRLRERRLAEVRDGILRVATSQTNDYDKMSWLMGQVFTYVVLRTAVGGPSGPVTTLDPRANPAEVKEVEACMESVFPRAGLRSFLGLSREVRSAQLDELAHLVLGIRLYNYKEGNTEGAGLVDCAERALTCARDVHTRATVAVRTAQEQCRQYTEVLTAASSEVAAAVKAAGAEAAGTSPAQQRARWRDELTNRRQLVSFLSRLIDDAAEGQERVEEAVAALRGTQEQLRESVAQASAVSKATVYPLFDQLAKAAMRAAALWHALEARRTCLDRLMPHCPPAACTLGLAVVRALRAQRAERRRAGHSPAPQTEAAERLQAATGPLPGGASAGGAGGSGAGVERLMLEAGPEVMELPLALEGYCAVSLVRHDGVLVSGDSQLGVLRWQGQHFAVADEEAAEAFQSRPAEVYAAALAVVRRRPELVHLLKLGGEFQEADLDAIIAASVGQKPAAPAAAAAAGGEAGPAEGDDGLVAAAAATGNTREVGVNTPVHFVERNIIPTYTFSEWELRRRVLKIADLRKKRTVSAQTEESGFRQHTSQQTWLPRDATTNTMVEASTNPEHRRTYLVGLRGGPVPVPPRPSDSDETQAATKRKLAEDTKTHASIVDLRFHP